MLDALGPDARVLAAAGALIVLPGILVVRSPWRAMPALSLAFWVLSWTWLGGAPRLRVLQISLLAFGTLAAFRVLRPHPLPRPRGTDLALAAAAIILALPLAVHLVPAGARLPRESVTAALLAWRDGWPLSFEPLLSLRPFRASGLAALAGDLVLLAGAAPYRAAFVACVLGDLALLVALWSFAEIRAAPRRATTIAALAMLATVDRAGAGPSALATAFVVQAAALWYDRKGRPSAFAAGACVAAALATDPETGLAAMAVAVIGARILRLDRDRSVDRQPARRRVALFAALVLAAPLVLRWPPIVTPSAGPLLAFVVTVLLGALAARAGGRASSIPWISAAGALLFVAAAAHAVHAAVTADATASTGEIAAMVWMREHTRPLDVVCAPNVAPARWIPAVAARATDVERSEGSTVAAPCAAWIALRGVAPSSAPTREPPAYQSAEARVWTTSQGR
ncbi:MAG TPA: hypothetical protein VGQ33_04665 [Vicinamibacteria bacterium]|nr:hypothetical protein [Vicinamibacteria bacterium]